MYQILENPNVTHSQEHLHQIQKRLQSQDIWLGFNEPIGGIHLEEKYSDCKPLKQHGKWQIQDLGIAIKTYEHTLAEFNELLRYLYLQTNKGHRLRVAVVHPKSQTFANKHKRTYSSNFFEGVRYFLNQEDADDYLQSYKVVQTIDLQEWSYNRQTFDKLLESAASPENQEILV